MDAAQKAASDWITTNLAGLRKLNSTTENYTKEWNKTAKSEIIFTPKSLMTLRSVDAAVWIDLVELFFLQRPTTGKPAFDSWPPNAMKALVLLVFWPQNETREKAHRLLSRIVDKYAGAFAIEMADAVFTRAMKGTIDMALRKAAQRELGLDSKAAWVVPGEWQAEVLSLLQKSKLKDKEIPQFAASTLLLASMPRLTEARSDAWTQWFESFKAANGNFKADAQFINHLLDKILNCEFVEAKVIALKTILQLDIENLKESLWTRVEESLESIDLSRYKRITEQQVAVYRIPEGELHNKAVLKFDEKAELAARVGNKKMSDKDKKVLLELIQDEKAKLEKENKLTALQQELKDKELAKEKLIREEIHALYLNAQKRLDEATSLVKADPQGAFSKPHLLYDVCIPLLENPLISQDAAHLLLAFRDVAFPNSDDNLDIYIGKVALRVLESQWKEPPTAEKPKKEQENGTENGEITEDIQEGTLEELLKKAFSLLNERTFVMDMEDDEFELEEEELVGAPQLTFLLPIVKRILEDDNYEETAKMDAAQLLQNALIKQFFKNRAVLRLPLVEYGNLLLEQYATTESNTILQALKNLIILVAESESLSEEVIDLVKAVLEYLTNENAAIRESIVKVLSSAHLIRRLVEHSSDKEFVLSLLVRLNIARFDDEEGVANEAVNLWLAEELGDPKEEIGEKLIGECVSPIRFVRESAARALDDLVQLYPAQMENYLNRLEKIYAELYDMRGAQFDSVGRLLKDAVDEWEQRSGVGTALGYLAEQVEAPLAEKLIKIVVPKGLVDRNAECRKLMTEAAAETIKRHGTAVLDKILPFLESLQEKTSVDAKDDNMRQGLVVLLGTLARYIPKKEKIESIVFRLVGTLSTPSQPVQEAACQCLAPLANLLDQKTIKEIVLNLVAILLEGKSYAERRGAAYGIGGLIKGLGTLAMQDYDLLSIIEKNLSDKSSAAHRQGGLLALEILCSSIGRLFEPYIIYVLPSLLNCFADQDDKVRDSAHMTANAMMASLSTYGTRLVLPSLLEALDNDNWRAKCSAAELLGSVAHLAPQQLSASLPSIVPKLIEVLADSSSKVQRSGEKAMQQIADVVRNPEIIGITKQLMAGLIDPVNKTNYSLQAVLNTKFIHYIDSPSLALLMPVVKRAFEDRNSDTRRIAAQIIASIYSLTDPMDTEPYLTTLVPGIQKSLLDPVPEIRTVSARALGAIIAKSSPQVTMHLQREIIPWLKEKLVCPQSTVDRSGAAQGLCEVLAGCGKEQLDYVMPEIIQATESTEVSPETRDGYILMYIYLPMTFKEGFIPYLPKVVPPILKALADENEYVRASALKAGQRLIMQYMQHAKRLLLPELQLAMMDDNWRIRHAAVTLVGDFLFNITGVTGKSTTSTANEDDTMGMEQAGKVIVRALGQQTRDKVIAGLYLARSDVALVVRQAASHVWKIVVSNTPRTLREIIKHLFEMIVDSLVSPCEERQQSGARCLGELVKKMGDKVINDILPILEVNQKSDDVAKRTGVAVALYEIIANMSKDVLNHYLSQLVPAIRCSIADEDEDVREAAADTFSKLYLSVGHEALDSIIMPLLEELTPEQDYVLDGLCEVMKQNSRTMLPYLLPKLTKPPVNVHALCKLASVAGDSLARQLPKVLDALLASSKENSDDDPMIGPCEEVVLSVTDEDGVPVLIEYLLKKAHSKNVPAIVLLQRYIEKCPIDLTEFVVELLPGLLALYGGQYEAPTVEHAVLAAIALTQKADMRESVWEILHPVKKSINMLISQAKGRVIPGLQHPKGLNPLIGILRDTILQGGVELKQLAGETLSAVIIQASDKSLTPHIVTVTGTLIRVLGDRFPPDVKLSLLECLSRMLDKVDTQMKPFLAPMQTTFLKAMQELTSKPVRLAAGGALARLVKNIHPKPEPIITEMFKVLATTQDQYLQESTFVSARSVVRYCADKLQQTTIEEGYRVCALVYEASLENMSDLDRSLTSVSGALLGELVVRTRQFDTKAHIFKDLETASNPLRIRQAIAVALQQMCQSDASSVWSEANAPCRAALSAAFLCNDPVIVQATVRASAYILISNGSEPDRDLLQSMMRCINHQLVEVRRTTAMAAGHICARREEPMTVEQLKLIIPQLINGTRESNSTVRSASELALVYAFNFQKNTDLYDAYRDSVGQATKGNLDEIQVSLRRVVKSGDMNLEPLENILSTP